MIFIKSETRRSLLRNFKILAFFFLPFTITNAQKVTYNWYFGAYAGIDFSVSPPVPIITGSLTTGEGCASISDNTGALLFYTDGVTVWDKSNFVMPNGTALMGDPSTTQSALVVPEPGSDSLFYIFTADAEAKINPLANGFRYSIVDMSLNGSKGDVSTKNTLLLQPASEKITAVKHCNEKDVWVMAHEWQSDAFYAYDISASGISTPVITNIGQVHTGPGSALWNALGQMKFSADGKKIVVAINNQGLQVFDFDNSSGIVSNPITITKTNLYYYGASFSQNGLVLYADEDGLYNGGQKRLVYQYDLSSGVQATINSSKLLLGFSGGNQSGTMQLAPDGRLYMAEYNDSISYVQNPNMVGTGCGFVKSGFGLGGKISYSGLPNFIESYFDTTTTIPDTLKAGFTYTKVCLGDSTAFADTSSGNPISWNWNFGELQSGIKNNSSIKNPKHLFSSAGTYTVALIISKHCIDPDTAITIVRVDTSLIIDIGPDLAICLEKGDSLLLGWTNPQYTYEWSTAETSSSIWVNAPGNYSVIVKLAGQACQGQDDVDVIRQDCDSPSLFIPSEFTPNGDHVNDIFYVYGTKIASLNFNVYNRWGAQIFESKNKDIGWDARLPDRQGKYQGEFVEEDVYVYSAVGTWENGSAFNRKGLVTVIR